jgi:hypothetical protein
MFDRVPGMLRRCGSADALSVNIKGYEPGIEKLNGALAAEAGCSAIGTPACPNASVYAEMTATISAPGRYGPVQQPVCQARLGAIWRACAGLAVVHR